MSEQQGTNQYVAEITYEDGVRVRLDLDKRGLDALGSALMENLPVFNYRNDSFKYRDDSRGAFLYVSLSRVRCIVGGLESKDTPSVTFRR
jgi:hypothetical protein